MGLGDDIFVRKDDALSELRCPICHDIFEDPVMGPCQCTFCRSCIIEALARRGVCPMDRRELQMQDLVPHRFVRSHIDALEVFCSHKHVGCFWRGRLDSLAGHEETCAAKVAQEAQDEVKRQYSKLQELRTGIIARDAELETLNLAIETQIEESRELTSRVTDLNCTVQKLHSKVAKQKSEIKERDAEMHDLKEQLQAWTFQKRLSAFCGKRKRTDPGEHV